MTQPIHPKMFRDMTPRQRRLLAERRRREVAEAAAAPRGPLDQLIGILDGLLSPPACDVCGLQVVGWRRRGLCSRCYGRERYHAARVHVDEVAVQRVVSGHAPLSVSKAEQLESLRAMVAAGLSDEQMAERLGVTSRTVLRRRQANGIQTRWVA